LNAKFIKDLDGFSGSAKLFSVDPPIKDYDGETSFSHVVVSATIAMYSGAKTYIFGANADGRVIDWGELPGSYRGGLSHTDALEGAGYAVDMTPAQIIDATPTPKALLN